MIQGIEKIKVLKCVIIKKEISKGRDGELIVNNCGPVVFKKRKNREEAQSNNSNSRYGDEEEEEEGEEETELKSNTDDFRSYDKLT